MTTSDGIFQCVVIAPQGTLVNCAATSVVFPGYDGFIGVLPHHIPMFCQLGLDIMKIERFSSNRLAKNYIYLLINRGFLLIGPNVLTVTTPEAFSFEGMDAKKIEQSLDKVRNRFVTGAFTKRQRWVENRKLLLLTKLAGLYTMPTGKS